MNFTWLKLEFGLREWHWWGVRRWRWRIRSDSMNPCRYSGTCCEQVEICISVKLKHDRRLISMFNSLLNFQRITILPCCMKWRLIYRRAESTKVYSWNIPGTIKLWQMYYSKHWPCSEDKGTYTAHAAQAPLMHSCLRVMMSLAPWRCLWEMPWIQTVCLSFQ